MTLIKICGITNIADAIEASRLGVDMLGFVFYDRSERHVDSKTVREIANELPESIVKVGVFVNEAMSKVRVIAEDAALDALQFHGDETPAYCASFKAEYKVIKAFGLKDRRDLKPINSYDVDFYLLDAYHHAKRGGTGEVFDWRILKDFELLKPVILSGGLRPDNVRKAISEAAPYGVDVSSGVEESVGKKDKRLLDMFVEEARKVK